MVFDRKSLLIASILLVGIYGPGSAQETTSDNAEATASTEDTVSDDNGQETAEDDQEFADLLTEEELDDLVAPIALYPDTLLIQVLVAATYPIDVIKANRFVEANSDMEQEALNEAVEAEGWDASVAVLAQGFPSVLANMAEHIDWTELAGSAMLAQSDDVMDAVQRMREQADAFGNLESNEQQVVTRDETEAIVIAPADPQVVYVPTYTTSSVYYRYDPLITFTTGIIIGAIWANNNRWNNYWGCRNCGGWNGRPVHHRPTNINVNGNVNIGNNVNVGNRGSGNWNPSDRQKDRARNNIGDRKAEGRPGGGKTTRPLGRENGGRGDDMRRDLSNRSGARDISRPSTGGSRPSVGSADRARPSTNNRSTRPSTGAASGNRTPNKANRSTTQKPKASKPSTSRQPTKKSTQKRSNSSFQSHGGGKASRSSKSRGSASRSRSGGGGGRSRGGGGRR